MIALPTLNVHLRGELVRSIRGARPKAALLRELEDLLREPPPTT